MVDWEKNIPPIVGNRAIGTKHEDPKTLALSGEKPFIKPSPATPNPVQSKPQQRREEPKQVSRVASTPPAQSKPKEKDKPKRKSKPRQTVDVSTHIEYLERLAKETGIGSVNGVLNMIVYDHKLKTLLS